MFDAINASLSAMNMDQFKLQTVSQNIANINTPAFRRQTLEHPSFDNLLNHPIKHVSPYETSNQGALEQTFKNTDIALSNHGFFQVQNDQGIFYTRRGDFKINSLGELTTANGDLVFGNHGIVKLEDDHFTVDAQGTIIVDHQPVDQLHLVQFENKDDLFYVGQGLYQSQALPIPVDSSIHVKQGFLERSNIKSMDEMMEMIKISRHFEANQRVMREANALLAMAINHLGESNV